MVCWRECRRKSRSPFRPRPRTSSSASWTAAQATSTRSTPSRMLKQQKGKRSAPRPSPRRRRATPAACGSAALGSSSSGARAACGSAICSRMSPKWPTTCAWCARWSASPLARAAEPAAAHRPHLGSGPEHRAPGFPTDLAPRITIARLRRAQQRLGSQRRHGKLRQLASSPPAIRPRWSVPRECPSTTSSPAIRRRAAPQAGPAGRTGRGVRRRRPPTRRPSKAPSPTTKRRSSCRAPMPDDGRRQPRA